MSRLEGARLVCAHPDLGLTASFGFTSSHTGEGIDALIARVDSALYGAKTGGRNRVVGSTGLP